MAERLVDRFYELGWLPQCIRILRRLKFSKIDRWSMEDKLESALEFLESLDSRQSQVLDDLDALNARIEAVLGQYSQHRTGNSDTVGAESVND